MVRTKVHTCKDCNKDYASYQSLCNHRTKFHKVNNVDPGQHKVNIDNNIGQHSVNINTISTLSQIETVKQYNCRKCNKIYKYKQSRWVHEKTCNEIVIKENKSEIIETQNT